MDFRSLWSLSPQARPASVVTGAGYRITVLTPRLLRLEYEPDGQFCDSATFLATCRDFPPADFTVSRERGWLTLETTHLRLRYDERPFSAAGLYVTLKGAYADFASVWRYGQATDNLGGTVRTLDTVDGETPWRTASCPPRASPRWMTRTPC